MLWSHFWKWNCNDWLGGSQNTSFYHFRELRETKRRVSDKPKTVINTKFQMWPTKTLCTCNRDTKNSVRASGASWRERSFEWKKTFFSYKIKTKNKLFEKTNLFPLRQLKQNWKYKGIFYLLSIRLYTHLFITIFFYTWISWKTRLATICDLSDLSHSKTQSRTNSRCC